MEFHYICEVHFYSQNVYAVFPFCAEGKEYLREGELQSLTLFVLRMLVNFGVNSTSDTLAKALLEMPKMIPLFASGKHDGDLQLVRHTGEDGRHRFRSFLNLTDGKIEYQFIPQGFGWFSTGVGYYGPMAVMGLVRFFALERSNDPIYHRSMGEICRTLGSMHLNRQLTLTGQNFLARRIVANILELQAENELATLNETGINWERAKQQIRKEVREGIQRWERLLIETQKPDEEQNVLFTLPLVGAYLAIEVAIGQAIKEGEMGPMLSWATIDAPNWKLVIAALLKFHYINSYLLSGRSKAARLAVDFQLYGVIEVLGFSGTRVAMQLRNLDDVIIPGEDLEEIRYLALRELYEMIALIHDLPEIDGQNSVMMREFRLWANIAVKCFENWAMIRNADDWQTKVRDRLQVF